MASGLRYRGGQRQKSKYTIGPPVVAEAALQPPETALTLYWKNGTVATTDVPYAETKEQLGGIGILEALDMNSAERLMAQHPSLKYGSVFEIWPAADKNEIIKAREQRQRQNTAR